MTTRRDFLKTGGALIVSFGAATLLPRAVAAAPGEAIARGCGVACVAYEGHNGYAALIADVDVHVATGVVHPRRYIIAHDCGPISNPDGLRNQIEGGLLQGTSRALVEEVTWDERRVTSVDWSSYASLHLDYDMPAIETVFVTPQAYLIHCASRLRAICEIWISSVPP